MACEIRDTRFREVVGENVEVEALATGFLFTEGPIWHPYEHHLTFSDMPGNIMRRWSAEQGIAVFREPSNMANGNTYDRQGRLVTCEHATSSVTRTNDDGSIETLATHYKGKQLNSPNDIVVARDGAVCFTDPTYGRMAFYGVERDQDLSFQGVYRIPSGGGELQLLADDFEQPNGLCFSPDGSLMYINDTPRSHIRVFEVRADGKLGQSRVFAQVTGEGDGLPDGLKVDSEGNVYCTGPGGIHVFSSEGDCLGVVRVPEVVANFTWGDEDMRGLFITASTSLYHARVLTPGVPQF